MAKDRVTITLDGQQNKVKLTLILMPKTVFFSYLSFLKNGEVFRFQVVHFLNDAEEVTDNQKERISQ